MAELTDDTMVYPLMLELAACLKAEYKKEMSDVALASGEFIPVELGEDCDLASGFVRLVIGYPSEGNFPSPEPGAQPCGVTLAFQLFVGVMRCAPEMDSEGNIATADYNAWTAQQLADMAAALRAIRCCFAGKFDDQLHAVMDWTPIEIQGNMGGGQWQVVLQELGA